MDVEMAIRINNETFYNAVRICSEKSVKLFCPSSISAYGFTDFRDKLNVNENTYQRPTTIYGVTKVYMELLGSYYHNKSGLDFRSLRYPGVLSPVMPHGGTTDYAIGGLTRDVAQRRAGQALRLLP